MTGTSAMKKPPRPKKGKKEPTAPMQPVPRPSRAQSAFPIVGIGASAGGLEALELF
jgi:chemotaxis response regulator CheB